MIIEEVKKNKNSLAEAVKNIFKNLGISINVLNDTYDSAISLKEDLVNIIPSLQDVFAEKLKDAQNLIIKFIGLGPFNALYYGKKVLDIVRLIYRAFTDQNIKDRLRSWGKLIGTGIEFFTEKPTDMLVNMYKSIFHPQEKRKKLKKIKKKFY